MADIKEVPKDAGTYREHGLEALAEYEDRRLKNGWRTSARQWKMKKNHGSIMDY